MSVEHPTDLGAGSRWMMAAAMVLIGVGTVLSQPDVATLLVVLSLAAISGAVLTPRTSMLRLIGRRSVVMVIVVGIGLEALILTAQSTVPGLPYRLAVLAVALIGIHAVLFDMKWRVFEAMFVVLAHFALMAVMLASSGPPISDVFQIQQEGAAALLDGENPFALRFMRTVGPDSPYYAPELVDGNRLNFGFVYPPLSLLMALPGYAIAGDYRYAALASLSIAATLIILIRPGQFPIAAALLILFAPVTPFILYWGWTEPFVVLLTCASMFLAVRRATSTPYALGLLIASKQYIAPLLILAAVLLRDVRRHVGWRPFVLIPLLVAAITIVPFLVWDIASFIHSTVTVQILQPFRIDSISVPALLVRSGAPVIPAWIAFALAALTAAMVLWRAPRTAAGFCGGAALVLIVFFLFSKYAFGHYYFLPLVLAGIAIALAGSSDHNSVPNAGATI